MYGIEMTATAEQEWQNYIKFYDKRQMDPQAAKILGAFMMENFFDVSTNPQKQNALKQVIAALSYEMSVTLKDVQIISDPTLRIMGGYDNKSNTLVLNVGCQEFFGLDKEKILSTIIHELRHAQQYNIICRMPNTEIGPVMAHGLENYYKPGTTLVRDSLYYSNIVEVDAEATSFEMIDSLISKLKDLKDYPGLEVKLDELQRANNKEKQEFEQRLAEAQEVVKVSREARKQLFDGIEKYGKQLFSPENQNNDLYSQETSQVLVEQLNSLIAGSSGKQIVDFTESDLYWLKRRFFEGCDIYQIVDHLDDPMVKYMEELEGQFRDLGLDSYGRYRKRLIEMIGKVKRIYTENGIECENAKNSEILRMGEKVFPQLIVNNLADPSKSKTISATNNAVFSYTCHVRGSYEKLVEDASKLAMSTVPEAHLRAMIEQAEKEDSWGSSSSPLQFVNVLNHYRQLNSQYNRKKLESFLTSHGVKTDSMTFSQCYDAYQKLALKIVAKNITKEKDSSREDKDAAFCAYYCDLTPEMLRAELSKIPFAKAKLEKMLKQEKPSTIVEILKAARFDFDEVFNPTNHKNKTTQTQE